jgi:hypothetical protein
MSRRQPDTSRLDWCDHIMAQGPGSALQLSRLPTGKLRLLWVDDAGTERSLVGGGMRELIDQAIDIAREQEEEGEG